MTNSKKKLITVTLLVTAFISLLNQTLLLTALPTMAKDLNISIPTAQWLTAGYVLMVGIATPISATLTEKFTSRQLYLSVIANFIFGTILAVIANNFYLILLARLVQAASSGILMTFVIISLVSMNPPEKRGVVMGFISLVISSAPAIGPSLAGLILHFYSWHFLFYLILPIMVVAWLVGYFFLPNFTEKNDQVTIDYLSIVTSSLGLGAFLASITLFLSQPIGAIALFISGLILLGLFVKRQFQLPQPMLNLKLFQMKSFRKMVITSMLIFGILLGTEAVLPIFFESVNGYSSLTSGLILLPGAFASGITAPLVGKYYDNHGPGKPIMVGLILIMLSSLVFLTTNATTSMLSVILIYTIRLIGVSMIMSTANVEALNGLQGPAIGHGTALNNSLRQVSGSIVSTVMMVLLMSAPNLVTGLHYAIGLTIVAATVILIVSLSYMKKSLSRG